MAAFTDYVTALASKQLDPPPVVLRSPFNGATIEVAPDDPQLPVFLQAGFTRVGTPKKKDPQKEKPSHG